MASSLLQRAAPALREPKRLSIVTRVSKRGVLRLAVVVALVVLVGAGVATGLLGGSDAQKHVEVKRGDPVPTNINRADDYGADTLRA